MPKEKHDPKSVTELLQKVEPEFGELIEAIRTLILQTDKTIGEQIKWNSPSFFYQGEMKDFNSKEYKRDRIVLHIRKGIALLIFPQAQKLRVVF